MSGLTQIRTLLFVPCPKGHRLAKVVTAAGGPGPVVLVQGTRSRRYDLPLADLLGDTVRFDPEGTYTVSGAVRTRCRCGPAGPIPGQWLRAQIEAGRRVAVWPEQ